MKTFLIRGIDPDLWAKVKVRAARDRQTIRAVVLRLLRLYVAGRV
jgi:plasmid stability protein